MAAKKRVVKKTTTRRKKVILPMVMSKLIDIALRDMRKALAKGWIIDMDSWFDPKTQVICSTVSDLIIKQYTVCSACAAGSVMAFSLAKTNQLNRTLTPSMFEGNEKQLQAIDSLRVGDAAYAARNLNLSANSDGYVSIGQLDTYIPDFDQTEPEPFFKAMTAFSAKLKKAGY